KTNFGRLARSGVLMLLRKCLLTFLLVGLAPFGEAAHASVLGVLMGPAGLGGGGSNPLGIPPGADDLMVTYVTDKKSEWTVSIAPGIFYGTRQEFQRLYASIGGGLAINRNGAGPGMVSAFGFNLGDSWMFNGEYRQAIGYNFSSSSLINVYSLRIGAAVRF